MPYTPQLRRANGSGGGKHLEPDRNAARPQANIARDFGLQSGITIGPMPRQ